MINKRKIIKSSMNEEELKVFLFLKERLNEADHSKAVKKAILLLHFFLDQFQRSVSPELLEILFNNVKYKQDAYGCSFEDWLKDQDAKRDPTLKDP